MNILQTILARIFDKFKAKNPVLALAIISILVGFKFFLDSGDYLGVNESKIDEWVLFALAVLTGTRTTNILQEQKK
jgi:hypothetical protein